MAAPIQNYTITFVSEYGETLPPMTDVTRVIFPSSSFMVAKGASFVEWCYADGTRANEGDALSADTTLYARWDVNIVTIGEPRLHAIADAIRAKNGETTEYKPKEMADAILSIAGGGGSGGIQVARGTFSSTGATTAITGLSFTPKYVEIMAMNDGATYDASSGYSNYLISARQGALNGVNFHEWVVYRQSTKIFCGTGYPMFAVNIGFDANGFRVNPSAGGMAANFLPVTYSYIAIG